MKSTSKMKNAGVYLGGSYVITRLILFFIPGWEEIQAELLAVVNFILVTGKLALEKWLDSK